MALPPHLMEPRVTVSFATQLNRLQTCFLTSPRLPSWVTDPDNCAVTPTAERSQVELACPLPTVWASDQQRIVFDSVRHLSCTINVKDQAIELEDGSVIFDDPKTEESKRDGAFPAELISPVRFR